MPKTIQPRPRATQKPGFAALSTPSAYTKPNAMLKMMFATKSNAKPRTKPISSAKPPRYAAFAGERSTMLSAMPKPKHMSMTTSGTIKKLPHPLMPSPSSNHGSQIAQGQGRSQQPRRTQVEPALHVELLCEAALGADGRGGDLGDVAVLACRRLPAAGLWGARLWSGMRGPGRRRWTQPQRSAARPCPDRRR